MIEAHALGKFAEDLAAEYLISQGMRVLARNVKNKYGELDIAALDTTAKPEELVIVEVRCRTLGVTQSALDSIGPRKLSILRRASQAFIDSLEWSGIWRVDAIGITTNNKKAPDEWELEYVRDILQE